MSDKHVSGEYQIGDDQFLVLLADKASQFLYANPAYLEASGYAWEELRGTITARMVHKDTPKQVSEDMVRTLLTRRPWTGLIKNRRRNGQFYWLRLNLAPIYADGKFAGSLLVHSKPSRQEIEAIEPVYRSICAGEKRYLIHQGHPVRNTLWGHLGLRLSAFGLKARVWGAMLAINAIALAGVAAFSTGLPVLAPLLAIVTAVAGWYLSHTIVTPLRQAVRFANATAAGDLVATLDSDRTDEIGEVLRALGQMNVNIRATVVDIREGVRVVESATGGIADGTSELSERTSVQSGHLDRTAKSVEQINQHVRATAESCQQARQVAAKACGRAENSGQVIGEVISTMSALSASSREIEAIVEVIDSIAFQTNILALNAAVEAARAGEQGKGFAVVAGEVRSLAQRSAQSAREIRTLIADSVGKVGRGTELVDSAGKTIADVVAQVRRVSDLVGEIADAAADQASDMNQITQAVAHLEEATTQNTLLVGENTDAAERLRDQAARLAEAVAVFKLSRAEGLAMANATRLTSEQVREEVLNTRAA